MDLRRRDTRLPMSAPQRVPATRSDREDDEAVHTGDLADSPQHPDRVARAARGREPGVGQRATAWPTWPWLGRSRTCSARRPRIRRSRLIATLVADAPSAVTAIRVVRAAVWERVWRHRCPDADRAAARAPRSKDTDGSNRIAPGRRNVDLRLTRSIGRSFRAATSSFLRSMIRAPGACCFLKRLRLVQCVVPSG